ncbi:MAG: hypothetical protein JXA03_13190 [Bacteroidales bacterium]|nr:hypothetical protein [Bacteroidales bacterium]
MERISFRVLVILPALLFVSPETRAQFKVDAQLRNRLEFRDGYQKLLPDVSMPAVFISQRTRLSFSFENERIIFKFTPQDVRVWGDKKLASATGVFGDYASLDLFEGYAQLKAGSNICFSVGRQQLIYDNQRLLSARNWNQSGISYDALVARFQFGGWKMHVAGSWNTLAENSSENFYDPARIKSLNFLWLNRKFKENLSFSLLHIASGVTGTDTSNVIYFRQTSGFYCDYRKDKFNLQGDVYYQYGKSREAKNVSALLAGADAKYKAGKFTPGVGFEFLSGNSKTGADLTADHLFDVLYGARHRDLGYMDYFRNIPSHTQQGGIADYFLYLGFQVTKELSIYNAGHYFRLARNNPETPEDKNLGYENDLVLKYSFTDWGALEGGYLFLLPTETLRTLQSVPDRHFAQFAYLQLTLTPGLFIQENDHKK